MSKQCKKMAADAPKGFDLVDQLDQTTGLLASASQSFADLSALFEAIAAASGAGSLASRLAQTGLNMAESLNCDFDRYGREFGAVVERFSTALVLDQFRRFSVAEQSSLVSEAD